MPLGRYEKAAGQRSKSTVCRDAPAREFALSLRQLEKLMGKFDTRHSPKMSRRKRQRKLKARIARRAVAVKATRTKKPTGKKK
ncbi:MAG TPA: hypothetical protein VGP93_08090 [Polyangiaceae bacterium]|nr:hypothetical protein [Polyangiaceae bacterium]